jgi:hypothetical protein
VVPLAPLIHRSAWNKNSQKFTPRTPPVVCGFLCMGRAPLRSDVHKRTIIPLGCIMAPPGVGPRDLGLFVLPVLLALEPVLILLAVGHDGAFEGLTRI